MDKVDLFHFLIRQSVGRYLLSPVVEAYGSFIIKNSLSLPKDYSTAIALLNVLKHETQRPELLSNSSVAKLGKLVGWEALLVQILQCLDEWPKKPTGNHAIVH
jgi:hypothetical protein